MGTAQEQTRPPTVVHVRVLPLGLDDSGAFDVRDIIADMLDRGDDQTLLRSPIGRSDSGKPFLVACPTVRFSFADSGNWLACAVCETAGVGVDLERIRPILQADRIARRWAGETVKLSATEPARSRMFLAEWTAREAVLKATGEGLAGLESLEVVHSQEVGTWGFRDSLGMLWSVRDLELSPNRFGDRLVGAVAAPPPFRSVYS